MRRLRAGAGSLRSAGALLALSATLVLLPACRKASTAAVPRGKDDALTTAQLVEKGKALMERRKYFRARASLEKALGREDATRELLAEVNLLIADAYYHDGGILNLAEALSRYTSFLTFYPTHPKADYAQYQLGLCYLKQALGPDKDQSTTRKALDAFREIQRRHPASEWVEPAANQIAICRERLAESEMRVGLFYAKRRAWSGAIDRFRRVLEEYPSYTDLDRAYFELARALEETKRREEALIYFQGILEKFPDSRYAAEARQALGQEASPAERTAEAGDGDASARHRGSDPPIPEPGGR